MSFSSTAAHVLKAFSRADAQTRSQPSSLLAEEVLALHDHYRQPLFRFLLSLGLSNLNCEEVIQETFVALLRHLLAGKPRHNLRAWVFRVAHNQALKQRTREAAYVAIETLREQFDNASNPEQQFFERQRQLRLQAVVDALAPAERDCLALRVEGLRYREIAEVLGISLGSVAASLKRSLGKLAEVYER